ncbi:MAG TPA: dTDP-4-dehydrorhamnose reductase [Terriglobales bacterium]|nr:dTDP-4-dehydrorhamnose reductase [Terriglobales bacterium]
MRVIIFGGTGMLGKALVREWTQADDQVTSLGSKDADIRDLPQVVQAVQQIQPDWIVLSAAYTDVDGCETNRELGFDVNCRGALNVAQAAKKYNSKLLFVSTDYVFDGNGTAPYETGAPRGPKSVYGQSKAEAEVKIAQILPDACILRTSWLYGMGGKCFPDTILKLASSRPEIQVVDDQRGSPTYTNDLAQAIIQLCHKNAQGTVHVTDRGECSWFEFAREIVKASGLKTVVSPTTSDKFVRPAPRPKYSVLSPRSLDQYGITMPQWRDALQNYLNERQAAGTL